MAKAIATTSDFNSNSSLNEDNKDITLQVKKTVLENHGYNLGKNIGHGSYATVKLAKSKKHNCDVAIKIISKFQAPGDYLKKFLPREIEIFKSLKHPNLIRFLQAIETTHRVYIIMEYAENGSLLDKIIRSIRIDEDTSRKWFKQLIEATEYCHSHGVAHRDIKCENVLMDYHFNIKLSDFGFARSHLMQKDGIFVLSDTFCGSYAYASPEILKGIPYRPDLSDIWSTGIVLYAMVYGRFPFDDQYYPRLIKQVQNKVIFPKSPKISYGCRSLISRILVPQKFRLTIQKIKEDPWLITPVKSVETSAPSKSLDYLKLATEKIVDLEAHRTLVDQMAMLDDHLTKIND